MMDTYTIQYASRDTLFFSYHWNAKWILECTVCTWFFFLDGVYRYHLLAVVWFCCCWCWFHTNRWGGRAGCPCKLAQYDVDNLFVFIRKRFRWKSWMLQTGRANHTHRAHLSSLSSLPSTKEEEKEANPPPSCLFGHLGFGCFVHFWWYYALNTLSIGHRLQSTRFLSEKKSFFDVGRTKKLTTCWCQEHVYEERVFKDNPWIVSLWSYAALTFNDKT